MKTRGHLAFITTFALSILLFGLGMWRVASFDATRADCESVHCPLDSIATGDTDLVVVHRVEELGVFNLETPATLKLVRHLEAHREGRMALIVAHPSLGATILATYLRASPGQGLRRGIALRQVKPDTLANRRAASYIWALAASEGLEGFRAGSPPPPDWQEILDRAAATDRHALDLDASWAYPHIVMGVLSMYRYRALASEMKNDARTTEAWLAQAEYWLGKAGRLLTHDLGGYAGKDDTHCRSAIDTLSRAVAELQPDKGRSLDSPGARAYAASVLINACEVRTAAMLNDETLPDANGCLLNAQVLDCIDRAGAPCALAIALDSAIVRLDPKYQATRKARARVTIAEHLAAEALVRERWKAAALATGDSLKDNRVWAGRDSVLARIRRHVEPVFADTQVDQHERVRLARYLAEYSVALTRFGVPSDPVIRADLRGVLR